MPRTLLINVYTQAVSNDKPTFIRWISEFFNISDEVKPIDLAKKSYWEFEYEGKFYSVKKVDVLGKFAIGWSKLLKAERTDDSFTFSYKGNDGKAHSFAKFSDIIKKCDVEEIESLSDESQMDAAEEADLLLENPGVDDESWNLFLEMWDEEFSLALNENGFDPEDEQSVQDFLSTAENVQPLAILSDEPMTDEMIEADYDLVLFITEPLIVETDEGEKYLYGALALGLGGMDEALKDEDVSLQDLI